MTSLPKTCLLASTWDPPRHGSHSLAYRSTAGPRSTSVKIYITGATGFVGGAVVHAAQQRGHNVVAVPRFVITVTTTALPRSRFVRAQSVARRPITRSPSTTLPSSSTAISRSASLSKAKPMWARRFRTLVADLGLALGGEAHLRNLRRLSVGPFTLDGACTPEDIRLQPLVEMLKGMPIVEVDETVAKRVS